jgi:SAM-dependent methyltransferase
MLVFDRERLRRQQARAARNAPQRDFLLHHVADELAFRLQAISRDFRLGADVGAYHGMVARRLATALPHLTTISVTPALALARLCPTPRLVADEERLPLRNGAFDLVTSALSLHLVNDLPGALIQIRKALKADGLFMAALLGGDTLNELRDAFMRAESETARGVSPRVFPTADVRDLGALLQRAGFALPVVDRETLLVTYPSVFALLRELKDMGAGNVLHARSRTLLRRDTLAQAIAHYERLADAAGRIPATFDILYVSGWAPHESQQKPLKPGSAQARLADALHTKEFKAGGESQDAVPPARNLSQGPSQSG